MARCQVLLVGQDAGVETDDDADVLTETLVTLGRKLWGHAGETENGELDYQWLSQLRFVFQFGFGLFFYYAFSVFLLTLCVIQIHI